MVDECHLLRWSTRLSPSGSRQTQTSRTCRAWTGVAKPEPAERVDLAWSCQSRTSRTCRAWTGSCQIRTSRNCRAWSGVAKTQPSRTCRAWPGVPNPSQQNMLACAGVAKPEPAEHVVLGLELSNPTQQRMPLLLMPVPMTLTFLQHPCAAFALMYSLQELQPQLRSTQS